MNSFTSFLHHFAFNVYPYICLSVFLMGSLARFDRDQYTWKSDSSQLLRAGQLRWGSNLFHVGILFLFFGHSVGMLTPHALYEPFITPAQKQLLAIVAGGVAGLICFIGLSMLLWRRLFDPRIRNTSSFSDIAILLLLWAQLTLGLSSIFVSAQNLDGHEMVNLMAWAQGIVTAQPSAAAYLVDVHWIFKTHILLGLTIFLVFPFTRLVHVWSAPVWYLGRTGYQVVRTRRNLRAGVARSSVPRSAGE